MGEDEWEEFYMVVPEEEGALEELLYGWRAKCRGGGRRRKRDKFRVRGCLEDDYDGYGENMRGGGGGEAGRGSVGVSGRA